MSVSSQALGLAWLSFVIAAAFSVGRRPLRNNARCPDQAATAGNRSAAPRLHALRSVTSSWRVAPRLWHERRTRAAQRQSVREFADVIDLFALAVGSGRNLRLALVAVASRAPPTWVEPLGRVVSRIDGGVGAADALERLPVECGEHVHPLVTVLVSAERYGTALLPALDRLAIEARFDRRRHAEEVARRVPVKLLFPLVLCILPAFGALTVAPLLAGALGSLRLN